MLSNRIPLWTPDALLSRSASFVNQTNMPEFMQSFRCYWDEDFRIPQRFTVQQCRNPCRSTSLAKWSIRDRAPSRDVQSIFKWWTSFIYNNFDITCSNWKVFIMHRFQLLSLWNCVSERHDHRKTFWIKQIASAASIQMTQNQIINDFSSTGFSFTSRTCRALKPPRIMKGNAEFEFQVRVFQSLSLQIRMDNKRSPVRNHKSQWYQCHSLVPNASMSPQILFPFNWIRRWLDPTILPHGKNSDSVFIPVFLISLQGNEAANFSMDGIYELDRTTSRQRVTVPWHYS